MRIYGNSTRIPLLQRVADSTKVRMAFVLDDELSLSLPLSTFLLAIFPRSSKNRLPLLLR